MGFVQILKLFEFVTVSIPCIFLWLGVRKLAEYIYPPPLNLLDDECPSGRQIVKCLLKKEKSMNP